LVPDNAGYLLCTVANHSQILCLGISESEVQEDAWQLRHENKISDAGFARFQPHDYQAMFWTVRADPNRPSHLSAGSDEASCDRHIEATPPANPEQRTGVAPFKLGVHQSLPQLRPNDNLQLRKLPATFQPGAGIWGQLPVSEQSGPIPENMFWAKLIGRTTAVSTEMLNRADVSRDRGLGVVESPQFLQHDPA
jgi:hypothetical protein